METSQANVLGRIESAPTVPENHDSGETNLLLQAFEVFTQASSSLETAFQELQAHARCLSQELDATNRELKKSLREKEEMQNYLKTILESLPCGVLVLDEKGRVTLCNPVAAEILALPKTKSVKTKGRKSRVLDKPGIREYLAASVSPAEGDRPEVEIPYVAGDQMRIIAASGTPFADASGNRQGALHILRDITEMKALEEQSKRGARLSAMGEMAVELAHEIRNPLGSIELFASLLEQELPRDSDQGRWAENIRIGSRSLNNIVSNMLHFANPLTPTFSAVDAHEVIQEILAFTEPIMRQREVRIEKSLQARCAVLYGDRELLKQMMLNLILNSMQAMPAKGSVSIVTRAIEQLPGGTACEGLELKIGDTGLGIPPENLGRIFDPFFTTNKNGTGLGLSVVHRIVERHSGFIHVESEVNLGTTFTITLPIARLLSGAA